MAKRVVSGADLRHNRGKWQAKHRWMATSVLSIPRRTQVMSAPFAGAHSKSHRTQESASSYDGITATNHCTQ